MNTFGAAPSLNFNADRATIVARVLDRVSRGEPLGVILREPGFPAEATWGEWMARDHTLQASFIAAVNEAIARRHELGA